MSAWLMCTLTSLTTFSCVISLSNCNNKREREERMKNCVERGKEKVRLGIELVTMISRMAVGETPSPSLDCLNFFMAMDLEGVPTGDLVRARKTRP